MKNGKISRIKETELSRYTDFFTESYQDNLKHSESTLSQFPRWSIISGYYAMHDISKLLIAKLYRFKLDSNVHSTAIELLRELLKDKETLRLIEAGYEEFQSLVQELSDAKKERVKVQYYTNTPFMKEEYNMVKVKTFSSQLRIFHVKEELETLDKTVNEFLKKNKIKKVVSVSDSATANIDGGTMGLIRVVAYE